MNAMQVGSVEDFASQSLDEALSHVASIVVVLWRSAFESESATCGGVIEREAKIDKGTNQMIFIKTDQDLQS